MEAKPECMEREFLNKISGTPTTTNNINFTLLINNVFKISILLSGGKNISKGLFHIYWLSLHFLVNVACVVDHDQAVHI
jgi:hypothetical protein